MNAPVNLSPGLRPSIKDIALRAQTELLVDKDFGALDRYWGDIYIQHNPNLANGLAALRVFKETMVPGATTTILHALGDGDRVFLVERVVGLMPVPVAFFDMYRLEDGKIVEHWDAFMPVPGPNAGNRTPFEGSFELNDLDKTEENRALVQKFVKRCLVLGDLSNLQRFLSKTLIQHSPGMADGTAAFVDYFRRQQWLAQGIVYGDVRHIVAEGNFVTTISQGTIGGVPHALWDLWRVQDGIIEEQWSLRTEIKVSGLHTNPMV